MSNEVPPTVSSETLVKKIGLVSSASAYRSAPKLTSIREVSNLTTMPGSMVSRASGRVINREPPPAASKGRPSDDSFKPGRRPVS